MAIEFFFASRKKFKALQLGIFWVSFLLISGCSLIEPTQINDLPHDSKKDFFPSKSILTNSPLVDAILSSPEASSAILKAEVARSEVFVARTAKATKVDFDGRSGLYKNLNSSTATGISYGSLSAYRLLYDANQTNRIISLAALAADVSAIEAEIVVDQALSAIILAFSSQRAAEESLAVIDKYLKQYDQREALIQSAVESGVISNSDYLEIRALRNDVTSRRARAQQLELSSMSSLAIFLPQNTENLIEVIRSRLGNNFNLLDLVQAAPRFKVLQRQAKIMELELQNLYSKKKPTAMLRAAINSPESSSSDATLFAGINVTFPVRDGGQTNAQISSLELKTKSIEINRDVEKRRVDDALSMWTEFVRFYDFQVSILDERLDIATEQISNLEIRLRAGKANIATVAKEILNAAQAEVEIIQLEDEWARAAITAATSINHTCAIVSLCTEINQGLGQAFQ